ncbi:MAG TPA: pyridoxal-dependent decarboxylase [Actinomycetes bacterium]|nr:pyridoxal-dependent decarboxylase [Actinomycetes bacterium]
MGDPITERDQTLAALRLVLEASEDYLRGLPDRPVWDPAAAPLLDEIAGKLPTKGLGTQQAVADLLRVGTATATASAGPRFFHFVIGGSTPASLAADWTTSLLDQNAFVRASSRLADVVEATSVRWLCDLVDLPDSWGGVLTPSATFGNLAGLGLATHWWAEQHGVDYTEQGLSALPRMPVLGGGYVHPSSRKALQMLGHGRASVELFTRDGVGRIDLVGLERRLESLSGAPVVIIATAGEPNAGDFDPIDAMADLAERHNTWLHIDGAFGLYAQLSPRSRHLTKGIDRADTIAADAHKWLNVPYESGFVLAKEPDRLGRAFGMPGAAYLPGPDDPRGGYGLLGPESSRRARGLPIWATLAAYGREGYRELVERHCSLAQYLARRIDDHDRLERLADVPLNIVCFRYNPQGPDEPNGKYDDSQMNAINRAIGERLLDDGRVFAGSTVYDGRAALRPALSNWMTTESDLDLFIDVVVELGEAASAGS